jgi:hypothetical protein
MSTDATSAIEHLKRVTALAERLAARGIAIYEHSYYLMAFGIWTIVAGRRIKRFTFSWDGRDEFLEISVSEHDSSAVPARWSHVRTEHIKARDLTIPFQFVAEYVEREYPA